jgi:excisionase family DNA binding protein
MADLIINPIAVSVRDATQILGLGRTRIYELINAGEIIAKKDGNRTLLLMASLRAYVDSLPLVTCQRPAKAMCDQDRPH